MLNPSQLESLVNKVTEVLPAGLGEVPENMQKNLKMTLSSVFQKMDLVSREEFDIQTQVLAKTRQKLEALEKQVAELESNLNKTDA
ncbi:accessory factor UbiK family protein [Thiosulfativibrio zosterae]|uniref:Ubiquinone biosynthesis accessory factor UbiK n=1 Tax=Thiosulfativibrio zosterae TaxID=2675053 RepID=A0A6F8PQ71_9GAMM|nr:accessory factor UbiK family protein [Thiosulfativibrio zosterae]BBP44255.1 hypothetical protein THMIRHAT_20010 [Thiosulfativibrio zosterae]